MVATLVDASSLVLHRARALGTRLFHRFGLHCATHQIRIILISCVVITSLFYPALALYSSSSYHHRSPSTPRLLAFLAGPASPRLRPQDDLDHLWSVHASLLIHDDAVSRARCGIERTLRIERILIHSSPSTPTALTQRTLLATLFLERHLQLQLSSTSTSPPPCLRPPPVLHSSEPSPSVPPPCFVLSPLSFWKHDPHAILADPHVRAVLSHKHNLSLPGDITLTSRMVLAGHGPHSQLVPSSGASYLALTFFFPETDCLSTAQHAEWLHLVDAAAKAAAAEHDQHPEIHVQKRLRMQTQVHVQKQDPTLIALEYSPNLARASTRPLSLSAISTFLTLAYAIFFLYVAIAMRRMTAVHSRIGLTFTALVEIAVSTITSLSVCALVGFKVTLVPWELLPIVIVFVGAENMFNLVDAVSKTSVTLPVKERIALGLAHAGTSNTLKVVSYNAILGTLAVLVPGSGTSSSAGAVRQFCVFAIVVLVAHWFLAHTFFMAVLSIDIQRLELEELLRQNSSLTPAVPNRPSSPRTSQSLPLWRRLVIGTQNILRGRATKNISLFLLLAITARLYYTTYPPMGSSPISPLIAEADVDDVHPIPPSTSFPLGQMRTSNANGMGDGGEVPAAWHVWKLLNPNEDPFVHLRIEAPTVLTFTSESFQYQGQSRGRRFASLAKLQRLGKRALWACYIVVFPIAVTTGLLYSLLLYLLKDAELLEAQRHRGGAEGDVGQDSTAGEADSRSSLGLPRSVLAGGGTGKGVGRKVEGRMRFWTLGRVMAADVEMMAASEDGRVVLGVSTQDEVFLWRIANGLSEESKNSGEKNLMNEKGGKGKGKGRMAMSVDVTDVLLHQRRTPSTNGSASTSVPSTITAVAVAANGEMCAVGMGAGVIAVWTIGGDAVRPLGSHLVLDDSSSAGAIVDLHFIGAGQSATTTAATAAGTSGPGNRRSFSGDTAKLESRPLGLLAVYECGLAALWTVDAPGHSQKLRRLSEKSVQTHYRNQQHQQPVVTRLVPSHPGVMVKCMAVRVVRGDERYVVAYAMQDGTVELAEVTSGDGKDVSGGTTVPLTPGCTLQAGTPSDPVAHVHMCRVEVGGRPRLVVVTATAAGVVSVWDGASGECISTFEEAFGGSEGEAGLSGIRVVPVAAGSGSGERRTCQVCGERLMEGFSVVISVGDVVLVYRAYVVGGVSGGKAGTTRWCGCLRKQPGNSMTASVRDMMDRRSRSGSVVGLSSSSGSTASSLSLTKRVKLSPSLSDPSPFPVSGHGVHSRRASEKDSMRRVSEVLAVPLPLEEQQVLQQQIEDSGSPMSSGRLSVWQQVIVVRTGHATCEKGAWDVVGECVVGVRRKSRGDGRSGTGTSQRPRSQQPSRSDQRQQGGLSAATLQRWEVWTFDLALSAYQSCPFGSVLADGASSGHSSRTQTTSTASPSSPSATSLSPSGAIDATPRLPFTTVSAFLVCGSGVFFVGLGNTIGVFVCTPS